MPYFALSRSVSLDEDELAGYIEGKDCPYFRFYDEYKSVNKQI